MVSIVIASMILVAVIVIAIKGWKNLDNSHYSGIQKDAQEYRARYIEKK